MEDPLRYSRGCVGAGIVALGMTAAVALVLFGLVLWTLQGRDVGPDADEMAEDPLLHVELPGATAEEISAHTGQEGGIMPAMANPTSTVFRTWTSESSERSESSDGPALLADAVAAADDHGVTWRSLDCYSHSVVVRGVKHVAVHDELVPATVSVSLRDIGGAGSPLRLTIRFDAGEGTVTQGPSASVIVPPEDCPVEVPEL